MGPARGGVGGSWVLLFHKELVPNQIMSLRTLQKASYFTRGKSLSFNNGYEPCRIWGAPHLDTLDLTRPFPHWLHAHPCCPPTQQGRSCLWELTGAVPPDENALLPDIN